MRDGGGMNDVNSTSASLSNEKEVRSRVGQKEIDIES